MANNGDTETAEPESIGSNALNDQIRESVEQLNQLLAANNSYTIRAMAYQALSHAMSLSIYNAVHQQQQMYTLLNATTTAAVQEALKSNPTQAIELAQKASHNMESITAAVVQAIELIEGMTRDLGNLESTSETANSATDVAEASTAVSAPGTVAADPDNQSGGAEA